MLWKVEGIESGTIKQDVLLYNAELFQICYYGKQIINNNDPLITLRLWGQTLILKKIHLHKTLLANMNNELGLDV